jgi:transcriptional regulator with XRE-family HTH domain
LPKLIVEARVAQTFGQAVRQRRDELNMSRWEVASKTKLDESTIYRIETGRSVPSTQAIKALSLVLGMDLGKVLEGDYTHTARTVVRKIMVGLMPTKESAIFVLPPASDPNGDTAFCGWRTTTNFNPVSNVVPGKPVEDYDLPTLVRALLARTLDCIVCSRRPGDPADHDDICRVATVVIYNEQNHHATLDLLILRDAVSDVAMAVWKYLKQLNQNLYALNRSVPTGDLEALEKHYSPDQSAWKFLAKKLFLTLKTAEMSLSPIWLNLIEKNDN